MIFTTPSFTLPLQENLQIPGMAETNQCLWENILKAEEYQSKLICLGEITDTAGDLWKEFDQESVNIQMIKDVQFRGY